MVKDVEWKDQATQPMFNCTLSNPAPWVDPKGNGEVYIAFSGGGCHGGLETIGVAKAPHWSEPFEFLSTEPIASIGPDDNDCPMGSLGEDPVSLVAYLLRGLATSITLLSNLMTAGALARWQARLAYHRYVRICSIRVVCRVVH
jgi:hypothetical protein